VIAARSLRAVKPRLNDHICFLCQQAIEKYLKALLQELGLTVRHTHDLEALLNLLLPHEPGLGRFRRGSRFLAQFAVDYRYPGAQANSRKAQAAFRWATRIRQEIRLRLGLPDKPKRP
jgi:HEPN domain-containing protein